MTPRARGQSLLGKVCIGHGRGPRVPRGRPAKVEVPRRSTDFVAGDADSPRRRVAATPRPATRIVRGDASRRGDAAAGDADSPRRRVAATSRPATRIVRGDAPRRRRGWRGERTKETGARPRYGCGPAVALRFRTPLDQMTAGFDELFPKNHLFFVRHGYWAPTRGGPRDVFLLLRDGAGSRSRAALGDDEFWAVGSIWARGWKPFHGGAKALTVPRRFLGNGRSVSEKRFWSEPTRARARPGRSWPRRARGGVRRTRPRPGL